MFEIIAIWIFGFIFSVNGAIPSTGKHFSLNMNCSKFLMQRALMQLLQCGEISNWFDEYQLFAVKTALKIIYKNNPNDFSELEKLAKNKEEFLKKLNELKSAHCSSKK